MHNINYEIEHIENQPMCYIVKHQQKCFTYSHLALVEHTEHTNNNEHDTTGNSLHIASHTDP